MLHRLPDFLMAALAAWLGLSLLVRAPGERVTRVFAWFCLCLAVYGLSAVLALLTNRLQVALALDHVQILATLLTPVAFLQFIQALVLPGKPSLDQRLLLAFFYAIAAALGAYVLLGPMDVQSYRDYLLPGAQPFLPWSPWGELRFPSTTLTTIWAVQRIVPLALALGLMARAYRRSASAGAVSAQQRLFFVLAAVVGVLGAVEGTISRVYLFTPALGRLFILLALGALAYAVLAYRSLLPPRVAQRAFLYSLLGGLVTIAYVSLLLGLEALARQLLGINTPVLTAVALVLLVALFSPLREWLSTRLDQRFFRREFDYSQLLNALSADLLSGGDLDEQFAPLLANVCRAIGAGEGLIAVQQPEGLRVVAGCGAAPPAEWALRDVVLPAQPLIEEAWQPWPTAELVLPLSQEGSAVGVLALGPRQNQEPYSDEAQVLLRAVASYMAVAVAHQRLREQEQRAIAALTEQGRALRQQQEELARQASDAISLIGREPPASSEPQEGLRVYCLGPLRVERENQPISRWGGTKAGTHQAEALFAFLFDRRGRGLGKDEAEEVIWPEQTLESADQAFHRTLSALRRTLEPSLKRGNESRAITYHHDRYWLAPQLIAWSDLDQFSALIAQGQRQLGQGQDGEALTALQEAIGLYRGAYMDDCPFFGDSSYVDEQRRVAEAEYVEALLAVGAIFERQGRAAEARSTYRRALSAAGGIYPQVEEALARLTSS